MDPAAISEIFDACFAGAPGLPVDRARMLPGGEEPVYLPPDAAHDHGRVYYAHGFATSALHEAAHWLYAGRARRARSDYGYWYLPDGRDAVAQARFEEQEWPVQAIECSCCAAAGVRFHFSADNLSSPEPSALFKRRVVDALPRCCCEPSVRLGRFQAALCAVSGQPRDELLARARSLAAGRRASLRHLRGADTEGFLGRVLTGR